MFAVSWWNLPNPTGLNSGASAFLLSSHFLSISVLKISRHSKHEPSESHFPHPLFLPKHDLHSPEFLSNIKPVFSPQLSHLDSVVQVWQKFGHKHSFPDK